MDLIGAIGVALIIWYGGYRVMQDALTLGALVAFIQYSQALFQPIRDLSDKYNVLQAAIVASHRIFKALDLPIAITSPEKPLKTERARGRIEFQNVWFAYNDEDWVLKDVSFTVEPGSRSRSSATPDQEDDDHEPADAFLRYPTRTHIARRRRSACGT